MSILEKEITMNIAGGNTKYYEKLGYHIPKYIDNQGNEKVKRGTKISVKVSDLPKGSNVKLTKVCDICGKKLPNISYNKIIGQRNVNNKYKDICKNCSYTFAWKTKKKNIPQEKTLYNWAINNNKEYLLKEYSNKNRLTASSISYGSNEYCLWNCPNCNSEYTMTVVERRKSNCPYCTGRKVNATNCLWTTHPEIANLLKNPHKGNELTAGSEKYEVFKCPECGFEQNKMIYNITKHGFSCKKCSDGISYPEKFLLNLLDQLKVEFDYQKQFNWSNNKIYDFYISDVNCIIEVNGKQHYVQPTGNWGNLKEIKDNDYFKLHIAKENNIKNYIIIDCRNSELNWIKNSIIKSELPNILGFKENDIDWNMCHANTFKTLLKKACDLYNSGVMNPTEIADILKLRRGTIRDYLKNGTLLGWCNYNPENWRLYKRYNPITKEIVQLTLEGEYISNYKSIKSASEKLNIGASNISCNCRGVSKTAKGFIFMYKEDYDKLIHNQEAN